MENKDDNEYLYEFQNSKGCTKPLFYFIIIGLLISFVLFLTSCSSFLLTGNEVFTEMYVKDSTGCEFKRAIVATNKLNRIGVYDLSFYLEYDKTKIRIPHMEMEMNHGNYNGLGIDSVLYTVTYDFRVGTHIKVQGDSTVIEVNTVDICK